MNLYIWSAYITKDIIGKFEKKTGIKVHYDTYDSNEALLEKMQSGVADYDVIVPSDYMVRIMIKAKSPGKAGSTQNRQHQESRCRDSRIRRSIRTTSIRLRTSGEQAESATTKQK